MRMITPSRRAALGAAGAALLAACGAGGRSAPRAGSLEWALAGDWRIDPERDRWRHPRATLRFWGLEADMTVLEILPGRGWMTAILAPFLARGGGHLIAAGFAPDDPVAARAQTQAYFEARFSANRRLFGDIEMRVASAAPGDLAAPDSVDLAILANNVHTLMAEGQAEPMFGAIFAALKPGGVLGVEQHRAASTGLQDPLASDGYVQEAYVRELAQEAGLEFVAASDINANPADTRDHPFGVWTLPPTLLTAPLGAPPNPAFDNARYRAIGESDRMTLKFRKPAGANKS